MDDHQVECRKQEFRALLQELAGGVETSGLEIARLFRIVANLYENAAFHRLRDSDLSGPRIGLLMRLYGEEKRSDGRGISPTDLSHHQRVSKNTISSLLRGLEEQGLIERTLDEDDRRVFRIRLSDVGRALVTETAPKHLAAMNELISGLSPDERRELVALLEKTQHSLVTNGACRTESPDPESHPVLEAE